MRRTYGLSAPYYSGMLSATASPPLALCTVLTFSPLLFGDALCNKYVDKTVNPLQHLSAPYYSGMLSATAPELFTSDSETHFQPPTIRGCSLQPGGVGGAPYASLFFQPPTIRGCSLQPNLSLSREYACSFAK